MAAEREREREQLKCWKIRHEPPLVVSWSAKEEEVAALETSWRSNSTAGEGGGGGGRRAPTQILLFECSASGPKFGYTCETEKRGRASQIY